MTEAQLDAKWRTLPMQGGAFVLPRARLEEFGKDICRVRKLSIDNDLMVRGMMGATKEGAFTIARQRIVVR